MEKPKNDSGSEKPTTQPKRILIQKRTVEALLVRTSIATGMMGETEGGGPGPGRPATQGY